MGRYTSTYERALVKGPGDARPTAMQIIQDENRLDGSLKDKIALVTGCTSGIGPDTAKALHAVGMNVWCTGRGISRLEDGLKSVGLDSSSSDGRIHFIDMDLSDQPSVRRAAAQFLSESPGGKLHILINNAGVMACPQDLRTKQGLDMQFGTNHIGHFLLFSLLSDAMISSSSSEFNSRLVNLSSSGHRFSAVRFDDYNFEKRPEEYGNGFPAYGQSKTSNIWMANYVDRLLGPQGLHAWSAMPGGIETPLQRHNPDMAELIKQPAIGRLMRSREQGAAPAIWCAVARELEGKGGKYTENCEIIGLAPENFEMLDYGYAKWAYDPEGEEKLWKLSCELAGIEG
ncbi:putative short-chain dehydrogenase protein [Zalerion maritima]|uniref:Short-chain dehydrogenase protein n=1 Tax=Zalerion maritima TaxID=339359 RepID=A0AAD5RXP2_9PEZI|nr:putative short-chain dehydrogenase protein [Zalerion maritima]